MTMSSSMSVPGEALSYWKATQQFEAVLASDAQGDGPLRGRRER
jgi:hypothetical protein